MQRNIYPGISLNNFALSSTSTKTGVISIHNNPLYNVYNGIYANNYRRRRVQCDSNDIQLRKMPTGFSAADTQYGIYHSSCDTNRILNNFVTAGGSNFSKMYAYHSQNNANYTTVLCNKAMNTEFGYSFLGVKRQIREHNDMNNHTYGYHLNGIIGPQGSSSSASDNTWSGTWTAGSMFQTYTRGSSLVASSPLYVRSGSVFNPTLNFAFPALPPHIYGLTASSLVTISPSDSFNNCSPTDTVFPSYLLLAPWVGEDTTDYGEDTGGDGNQQRVTAAGAHIRERISWVRQMSVYRSLLSDSTLDDSSSQLQRFFALAQNSRYAWLTQIEEQFADGNYSLADSMLSISKDVLMNDTEDTSLYVAMADGREADWVVENYLEYFRLFRKYVNGSAGQDDSISLSQLASMCPGIDGNIIYNARALYGMVSGTLIAKYDQCDTTGHMAKINPGKLHGKENKTYIIFPNPNNGYFTIMQNSISQLQPTNIQISNIAGAKISVLQPSFVTGKMQLNLEGVTPGIYVLVITEKDGSVYRYKFVKQ